LFDEGLLTSSSEITRFHDYTQPGGTNYRELLLTYPDSKQTYTKGHFEDFDNVLAHMRVSDRQTLDDKKVLYAEEIQSDWGQQGRNEGFRKNLSLEESHKLNDELFNLRKASDAKMDELKTAEKIDQSTVSFNDSSPERLKLKKLKEEHRKIEEKRIEIQKKLFGPPQAPFVTSTDKWTQLTIKKLLANAVQKGNYDYIAISPGKIQFDRWNQPGLRDYYDKVIPKNVDKVVKKLDKDAVEKIDMVVLTDNQPTLAIKLTDTLKEKVKKGQALFSVPAAVTAGAIASQGENDGN